MLKGSLLLLSVALVAAGGTWFAHGHGSPGVDSIAEELRLDDGQREQLARVFATLDRGRKAHHARMLEIHEALLERFEQGRVEEAELRGWVDEHVDELRSTGYTVVKDLVELANGLNDEQQAALARRARQHH